MSWEDQRFNYCSKENRESQRKSAGDFPELLWGARAMSLQLSVFVLVLTQPLESHSFFFAQFD